MTVQEVGVIIFVIGLFGYMGIGCLILGRAIAEGLDFEGVI